MGSEQKVTAHSALSVNPVFSRAKAAFFEAQGNDPWRLPWSRVSVNGSVTWPPAEPAPPRPMGDRLVAAGPRGPLHAWHTALSPDVQSVMLGREASCRVTRVVLLPT